MLVINIIFIKSDKISTKKVHQYDATKNCYNFEESYLECLKIYESKVV